MASHPIRVGDWIIYPELNRIESHNRSHNLGPRVMQLLLVLIKEPREVHSREELLRKIWDDVIVNEESLTKSISFLRQYFDQDGSYIETIRSVGYRWIGPEPIQVDTSVNHVARTKVFPSMTLRPIFWMSLIVISGFVMFTEIDLQTTPTEPRLVKLTDTKSRERVPRLSPDGHSVVFAQYTRDEGSMDLYTQDVKSGKAKRMTSSHSLETDPVWSPDGQKIAFYKSNSEDVTIVELDVNTGNQRKLVNANSIPNLSAMSWSPDGTWLAYSDYDHKLSKWCIYAYNTIDQTQKRLTTPTEFYGDVSPRFSPDGEKIAFIRIRERGLLFKHLIPGIGDVMVLDLNTNESIEVVDEEMEISGVEWLEGDDNLAIIRVKDHFKFEIISVDLNTSEKSPLYSSERLLRNLGKPWSKDRLVFEEWNERFSIWKADFTGQGTLNNFRPFLDMTDRSWHPQASHSGNHVVYVSTASGRTELWLRDIITKDDKQLTDIGHGIVRNPRWAPDDSKVLFEIYDNGDFNLHTIQMEDHKVTPLLATTAYERNAVWSENGNSIFFAKRIKGQQHHIYEYNLKTEKEQKLIDQAFAVKVYGEDLIYLSSKDWNLYHRTAIGDTKIISSLSGREWFNWEVVDDKLYYVKRHRPSSPSLYCYELTTGEEKNISWNNLNFSHVYQGFSIDAQNGTVYATVNDLAQSDIVMLDGINIPNQQQTLRVLSHSFPLFIP